MPLAAWRGPVLGPEQAGKALALLGTSARWVWRLDKRSLLPGLGLSFRSVTRSWGNGPLSFTVTKGGGSFGLCLGAPEGLALLRDSLHWDVLCPWLVVGVAPCESCA